MRSTSLTPYHFQARTMAHVLVSLAKLPVDTEVNISLAVDDENPELVAVMVEAENLVAAVLPANLPTVIRSCERMEETTGRRLYSTLARHLRDAGEAIARRPKLKSKRTRRVQQG